MTGYMRGLNKGTWSFLTATTLKRYVSKYLNRPPTKPKLLSLQDLCIKCEESGDKDAPVESGIGSDWETGRGKTCESASGTDSEDGTTHDGEYGKAQVVIIEALRCFVGRTFDIL